ncbi:polysaccharide biosynthesis protein [Rhodoflexus caldus]|uniref:polysaccharide biosynthesis protein n=1 Tax=Rhodoflexus caldus TaxID=2891236 RepID=UPI00202A105A|nr:nucleoside-diphosphate sugar epimerase/dehydratase [Rhodoflexus caldus]
MENVKKLLNRAFMHQMPIASIDLFLSVFAFVAAVALRFNMEVRSDIVEAIPATLLVIVIARGIAFYYFKTYSGIIRYAGVHDVMRIFSALVVSDAIIVMVYYASIVPQMSHAYSFSIAVICAILTLVLMLAYRFGLVIFYRYVKPEQQVSQQRKVNVVICGASNWALATKRTMENDALFNYRIVAFFDEDPTTTYKLLDGIRVISNHEQLDQIIQKYGVHKVVIAQNTLTGKYQAFADYCLQMGLEVLKIPPVHLWSGGSFQVKQLQQINIEDLLERDPIVLNSRHIMQFVKGRKVLVTGAAGSIGRELVRQIAHLNPVQLIILDKAESPLHELHLAIQEEVFFDDVVPVLANIASLPRMEEVFMQYKPDIVYHAAAYKHVPMLEAHPCEAVKNNIIGTKIVADLAVKYQAERFVMVSTDKAVNPTNVMGASKRMAEIYVQALNRSIMNTNTQFIITRFGNVLGSDGSVIPRFKKQIEAGGPVTVTSPKITRYFMTIPEACQLILEASTMGAAGQIFIFDMGKPVKIVDLAKKMIRLAGYEPDKDIAIHFTGLRPGEKLIEELLTDSEGLTRTYHPKIMIGQDKLSYTYNTVSAYMEAFRNALEKRDSMEMVRIMKKAIPEYISNNSVYQKLDKEKILIPVNTVSHA